jgi:glucose/arabinose dehydrogenase
MRRIALLVAIVLLLPFARVARGTGPDSPGVDVEPVAVVPHLVGIEHAGDGTGRLFLVGQHGVIRVLDPDDGLLEEPFLDIQDLVLLYGEQGLLGLAFDPDFETNGLFYIHYSTPPDGYSVIARYYAEPGSNVADPTGEILLTAEQLYQNHKGGQIRFGPDGFLYIAFGDGGDGGDPFDNGQGLNTILGKLLRINPHAPPETGERAYGIPETNPFVGQEDVAPEIWAYGLRNPWRFSFDKTTGDLYIADVGQSGREEVNFQLAASTGGQNYGWNRMEGSECFKPPAPCEVVGTLPVTEYSHALGCSVTGGFRYRGSQVPAFAGRFIFGDFCSGRIWGLAPDGPTAWTTRQLLDMDFLITTFGEDEAGELYVAKYDGEDSILYRFVPSEVAHPLLTVTKAGIGEGMVTTTPKLLECGAICGGHVAVDTTITLKAAAKPGWLFTGWSGDEDCEDGVVTLEANRSCVATFSSGFTDDPIVVGVTPVKALHITELRARVDILREQYSLAPFVWTDPVMTPGVTRLRAAHITDLRVALEEVYLAAERPAPVYSTVVVGAGDPIRAAFIAELRVAVRLLE